MCIFSTDISNLNEGDIRALENAIMLNFLRENFVTYCGPI